MTRTGSLLVLLLVLPSLPACNATPADSTENAPPGQPAATCIFVEEGYGPPGRVEVQAEVVASGLQVPWGFAFLPDGDILVTERPGRLRLVEDGDLVPEPVATVPTAAEGEGGLLGIALHPNFEQNRFFYLYYTTQQGGQAVNRVQRWGLAEDQRSASPNKIIVGGIPAARFHNGGRLRFSPDGMLYIGTGDATNPENAQSRSSLAGKILRVTPNGEVPTDNPFPGNPAFILGIRNTQGFAWPNDSTMWVVDHGPSGEFGWTGHDEVNVAHAGDNLGWPVIYGCQTHEGMVTPSLTWDTSVPPGGAAIYTGTAIPEWQGSLLIGTLDSRHLHRVVFEEGTARVAHHGIYLQDEWGRLRAVKRGPDGALYVTTSNCDGRGQCPPEEDVILRIPQ